MNLKNFKEIYQQVIEFENLGITFDIGIDNENRYTKNWDKADWLPFHYTVKNMAQLAAVQAKVKSTIRLDDVNNKLSLPQHTFKPCAEKVSKLQTSFALGTEFKSNYPTLKFYSKTLAERVSGMSEIKIIKSAPREETENGVTYRYVADEEYCDFCVPNTHFAYNYLDQGFFYVKVETNPANKWRSSPRGDDSRSKGVLIANELTVDVLLVMAMVMFRPAYAEHLQHECFINAATAKITRIKLEKLLQVPANGYNYELDRYTSARDFLMKEYEKTANSNILQKVIEDKIPHAIYNGIKLTKDKAVYENISIESEGLINALQNIAIFDERTDIYSVVRDFVRYTVTCIEKGLLTETNPENSISFKVNGIDINVKRTYENSRRTINGKHINIAELEEVLSQSTCYNDADEYNKFVKAVSKMSLKFHKAIANGIPVKIVDTLGHEDYRKPEAPPFAPKIRFKKDGSKYRLVISPTESVPVKLNTCISKLMQINRATNGGWSRRGGRRDYLSARRQVVQALIASCTFDELENIAANEPVFAYDAEGKPVLNADGTHSTVLQSVTRERKVTRQYLTVEQASFICKEAEEFQRKALEKSEIFLETAVKVTGAVKTTLDSHDGYLVQGKTKRYFVNEKTNVVHNYDTKAYVCIVEQGHQIQLGYDALAARLYALKNDSVMTQKINTLANA